MKKNKFLKQKSDEFKNFNYFPDMYSLKLRKGVMSKINVVKRVPLKIKDEIKLDVKELVIKKLLQKITNRVVGKSSKHRLITLSLFRS